MKKKGNILVGACGGIALYKTCGLIRLFVKSDYSVKTMLTSAAAQFIRPLLFKELSGEPVYTDMFSPASFDTQHIKLADWADLAVIAPLSANTLAKLAGGICDNLLTTVLCALAADKPLLLVPSMNDRMWSNPVVQKNIACLEKIKNYNLLRPEKGKLACGSEGVGRMPEPEKIYQKAKQLLDTL